MDMKKFYKTVFLWSIFKEKDTILILTIRINAHCIYSEGIQAQHKK